MGKRDLELKQVMTEEKSRGRAQPVSAVSLERQRRIRAAAKKLRDPGCDKRQYADLIRQDFGLSDDSPEFLQYMKIWEECRGR